MKYLTILREVTFYRVSIGDYLLDSSIALSKSPHKKSVTNGLPICIIIGVDITASYQKPFRGDAISNYNEGHRPIGHKCVVVIMKLILIINIILIR